MAQDKKSFVIYCDIIHTIKKLSNEKAGELFKLILSYVNDENPDIEKYDLIIQLTFEPIRQQLKRDLKHWESIKKIRSIAGKKGGRPKKQTKTKKTNGFFEKQTKAKKTNGFFEKQTKAKKAVSVNVNVNDNVNNYKNILLSKIKISDIPQRNENYFKITMAFYELFKRNLTEAGAKTINLDKAKGTWIDETRLLIEKDGYNLDQLRIIFNFLENDDFWKANILSMSKLRKQVDKLLLQINKDGKSNKGARPAEIAEIVARTFTS